MNPVTYEGLEVKYDVPTLPDLQKTDIQIPCLVIELDTLKLDI